MTKKVNCITIIITFGGTEKIKTEKKLTTTQSEENFFHQNSERKHQQTL